MNRVLFDKLQSLPVAITLTELQSLMRFKECVDDGEGYDLDNAEIQRLAKIGLVRHISAGLYELTLFGEAVASGTLDLPRSDAPSPSLTNSDNQVYLSQTQADYLKVKLATGVRSWNPLAVNVDEFIEIQNDHLQHFVKVAG